MGSFQVKQQLIELIKYDKVRDTIDLLDALDGRVTPLILAAQRGSIDMTMGLIETDNLGITALMWAAKFDHADVCLVLIRSNSNLRSRSNESLSSLDYSILHGNYKSAFIIYKFDKMIQSLEKYLSYSSVNKYDSINYGLFIQSLVKGIPPNLTVCFDQQSNEDDLDPLKQKWSAVIKSLIKQQQIIKD